MKNFLVKHWKDILIVLFVLFGVSKCSQSCTSNLKIKNINKELVKKDSIIDSLNQVIVEKVYDIELLNEKINVQGVQLENHYKIDSINASKEVHVLKNE